MRKFLLAINLFVGIFCSAQTTAIDTLRARLQKVTKADTNYVIDLNELAWQYLDYSVDSSNKYLQQALRTSRELNYVNGLIEAKNTQGILYRYNNQSEEAIQLYDDVISMRTQQGRLERLTGAYSNLGSVYYEMGDNTNALKYYLKAFDNATKFKQTENQMVLLGNIGNAYKSSGLTDLAIEAFKNGLKLNKVIKDKNQEAHLYLNLATVYDQQYLYKESVKYEKYAYEIFKKSGNTRQLSVILNNLSLSLRNLKDYTGTEAVLKEMEEVALLLNEKEVFVNLYKSRSLYFSERNKLPEALKEIDKALLLVDTVSDRLIYGSCLLNKAEIYQALGEDAKALAINERGINIMKTVDDKHHLAIAYADRSEILRAMGDHKQALDFYQLADALDDSINTDAFNTKMATLNALNDLDKKENELELSIKEKEAIEAKNARQSLFLTAALTVGALVIILLLFSVRAYFVKRRDNRLLNAQKKEIEIKNAALQERQAEIEIQKEIVEVKQKEILDSIHYAKRIQQTLLANHELINRNLPENFILFKPKDIVSGDFYWATEKNNYFYLAVCDSTGHGVPGAFMSLLNISFLNEAINEKNIKAPNEVLNHVRQKLIESVSQDGGHDGMDCVLLCFDKKESTITYAAAQNSLLLVSGNQLYEFPADKMPVGKGEKSDSFTLRTINGFKGDTLYLYSDGYADQFGGLKGKKFKNKPLHAELLKNSTLPMAQQSEIMNHTFETWRGALEQVDDVLLIGIRL